MTLRILPNWLKEYKKNSHFYRIDLINDKYQNNPRALMEIIRIELNYKVLDTAYNILLDNHVNKHSQYYIKYKDVFKWIVEENFEDEVHNNMKLITSDKDYPLMVRMSCEKYLYWFGQLSKLNEFNLHVWFCKNVLRFGGIKGIRKKKLHKDSYYNYSKKELYIYEKNILLNDSTYYI